MNTRLSAIQKYAYSEKTTLEGTFSLPMRFVPNEITWPSLDGKPSFQRHCLKKKILFSNQCKRSPIPWNCTIPSFADYLRISSELLQCYFGGHFFWKQTQFTWPPSSSYRRVLVLHKTLCLKEAVCYLRIPPWNISCLLSVRSAIMEDWPIAMGSQLCLEFAALGTVIIFILVSSLMHTCSMCC